MKRKDQRLTILLVLFFIYFISNFLFLIKYGVDQTYVSIYVLCICFVVLHIFLFLLMISKILSKIRIRNNLIFVVIVIFTIFYVVLSNAIKNPYDLEIDRWVTLQDSLRFWIKGEYIYDKINFLGNYPSYLPGQLLLSLPFFLIGNVGYLQVGCFLLFSFVVYKVFEKREVSFLLILLFGISLSYAYEAICKSDFISSFLFVIAFILLWNKKFESNYFQKPIFIGILLSILCLTRSLVIIPLILFLFKTFFETDKKSKALTLISFSLTTFILLASVFLPAKDLNQINEFNPFSLQGQSNKLLNIAFITITIIISFFINRINQVFYFSAIIIFLFMMFYGFEQMIKGISNEFFPVTYIASSFPFCLIGIGYLLESKNEAQIN